jgi:hypothetical protein
MRIIKSDFDKKRDRNIGAIKKAIQNLRGMGFRIEQDKNVETMFGSLVDNIYIRDYMNNKTKNKIILQKHLFTIE